MDPTHELEEFQEIYLYHLQIQEECSWRLAVDTEIGKENSNPQPIKNEDATKEREETAIPLPLLLSSFRRENKFHQQFWEITHLRKLEPSWFEGVFCTCRCFMQTLGYCHREMMKADSLLTISRNFALVLFSSSLSESSPDSVTEAVKEIIGKGKKKHISIEIPTHFLSCEKYQTFHLFYQEQIRRKAEYQLIWKERNPHQDLLINKIEEETCPKGFFVSFVESLTPLHIEWINQDQTKIFDLLKEIEISSSPEIWVCCYQFLKKADPLG